MNSDLFLRWKTSQFLTPLCFILRCDKRNLLYFNSMLLDWIKIWQDPSFSNKRDYKIPTFSTRSRISEAFTTFLAFIVICFRYSYVFRAFAARICQIRLELAKLGCCLSLKVTWKPKSVVPLQIIHFHRLKQHDVSILLRFFTTHYVKMISGWNHVMLHCLRQCSVFVREKWGIPRTTDVSVARVDLLFKVTEVKVRKKLQSCHVSSLFGVQCSYFV
jgi:hypothetical protein